MAAVKFAEVVVSRPFTIVEHEFVGQTAVGIKDRRTVARGEKLKLDAAFAREVIGALKAYPVGSAEAEELLAEVAAASKGKKAE